jgi:hypothetical protein
MMKSTKSRNGWLNILKIELLLIYRVRIGMYIYVDATWLTDCE